MTYDHVGDARSEAHRGDAQSPAKPYEAPRLTLVGNLNDLLAGTGSQNADTGGVCANGPTPNPDCD